MRANAIEPERMSPREGVPRVLFASHSCDLDDSNGAAVASRALMQALARRGFAVEVLCGSMLDLKVEVEPAAWLAARGDHFETLGGQAWTLDAQGMRPDVPDRSSAPWGSRGQGS